MDTPRNVVLLFLAEEIARQLQNSEAKFIITIGMFLPNIRQACEIYKGIQKIIVIGMEQTPDDCVSFMHMLLSGDGSNYDPVSSIISRCCSKNLSYFWVLMSPIISRC
jgi:hypothetical protein